MEQGSGPRKHEGIGNIDTALALGAGLVDSCAGCHGRLRGSAGNVGMILKRLLGRPDVAFATLIV
jgi:hypothetical protein